jgi:hypothetical protein
LGTQLQTIELKRLYRHLNIYYLYLSVQSQTVMPASDIVSELEGVKGNTRNEKGVGHGTQTRYIAFGRRLSYAAASPFALDGRKPTRPHTPSTNITVRDCEDGPCERTYATCDGLASCNNSLVILLLLAEESSGGRKSHADIQLSERDLNAESAESLDIGREHGTLSTIKWYSPGYWT